MNVNEKIRTLRELHNLTQEDVAKKIYLSTPSYAKLERGERKISFDELERIAMIYSLDVIELLNIDKQNILCFINSDSNMNNTNLNYYANQDYGAEIEKLKLTIQYQEQLLQEKNDLIEQQRQHIKTLSILLDTLNQQNP